MKHSQLIKMLRQTNCEIYRHGAKHDIWINTTNGKTTQVPRHGAQEIGKGLLYKIIKQLDI